MKWPLYLSGGLRISIEKDVLFFTERLDKNEMKKIINSLELKDEILHFGQLGSLLVKFDKSTYSQTSLS